ncbi:general substrate transporter [Exophiala viscosa]|uniref:general substrate transporter n=1 Tax=Exophiala viscosa TaxID=2486360 RepID=UPI0021937EC3|nr:general substrate transporter [Exophiala viscosa]
MSKPQAYYSWYNLSIVFALCLGSLTYGYCFSIISTTLGQPGFYAYFGLAAVATDPNYAYTNRILGATSGLFSAGAFMGCWTMGWMCDARGRKQALWIAATISLVGSALQAGSAAIGMFLFARWLTGYGVGNLVTLIPIMQAEISPPASRGFLVGQHGVVLVAGYTVAGWVGFGCFFATNPNFQWRFPLAVACLWPLLTLAVSPWIPESPRWLILRGSKDEAWTIIAKLHYNPADPEELYARREFDQMCRQVENDRLYFEHESVVDLFRKPSYRKRMICGFLTFFSNESSGILVIYNYSVLIYKGLGQTGYMPLLLSGVYVTLGAMGNWVNSMLVDRVGRKALFLTGLSGMLVSLIAETALVRFYAGTAGHGGLSAALFFIFLHLVFYGCCIDANSFVYCSEIFPTHIRPRGMAWSVGTLFLTTIPYLEAAPTAFATIGYRYYIVFIILTAINIPIIYFFFPEVSVAMTFPFLMRSKRTDVDCRPKAFHWKKSAKSLATM